MESVNRVEVGKTNLRDFLTKCHGLYHEHDPDLPEIILAVAQAVKYISSMLGRGKLTDLTGTVAANPFGEATKKIDALAHQAFFEGLFSTGKVAFIFSEERKVPDVGIPGAEYLVFIDPLDGSSLVGYNGTTGSIFSVYRRKGGWRFKRESGFPDLNLKDQVCAGYGLYGAATLLVFVLGGIVFEFVLNHFNGPHSISEFILSDAEVKIPIRGKTYSVNEAYSGGWPVELDDFIKELKGCGYSSRYVGSLVADFHRTLKEGGIFIYPATKKHPNGKLRLLYEAGPMAYIIQAAGGLATDYRLPPTDILNIRGANAIQTTPLVLGSPDEIALAELYLGIQPEPPF